ncbi:MAG: dagA [Chlamydiia bacterium]|nr:dagA [Chlamydiia bacterium]
MTELLSIMQTIETAIWGVPLLLLLIGVGVFLTCLLRGVQFRYLFKAFRFIKSKDEGKEIQGDISPFQSLMTAMASAVGTGSIVGVSTAIMTGGLGSIFWMWITTLVSMSIKYAEALLAVKYRITDKRGEMSGGPMYYIEKGLGWKWLAVLFSVFAAIAAIGTGNLVQVNSIAEAVGNVFHVDPLVTGIVLAVITAVVLLKGIKSIGFVSSVLVPVMATFYIIAGCIVLFAFSHKLPYAISLIISSAFTGQAACGGFLGATVMLGMQSGVSRSVLSSEAGLGISSIAAAAARTTSSGRQALLSMTATLLSTAIICTITALVIAVTGVMGSHDASGQVVNGASLAIKAFSSAIYGGEYIVTLGLVFFAYTTVIAWAYYGEKCCEYLFGEKSVVPYRILYTILIVPGAVLTLELVWSFSNIMNALMVIPNMIAILALSGVIQKETKEFLIDEAEQSIAAGRVAIGES